MFKDSKEGQTQFCKACEIVAKGGIHTAEYRPHTCGLYDLNGWKKYNQDILSPGSDCFYQKLIYGGKEDCTAIFAQIVEWTLNGKKSWELDMQISEEISPTKRTINIKSFSYRELDFVKIEKEAKKLVKQLIK